MNRIKCNVKTCKYNNMDECSASEIHVGCDNCVQPHCDHDTECCTFTPREG